MVGERNGKLSMQILKNVYQILGASYADIANIYVIEGEDGQLILVDTAETEEDYMLMKENMRLWGLDERKITHVLLTHKHFNHIGNAWRFRETGAKIVAGREDADAIETGNINEICDFNPFPKKEEYIPCGVDLRAKEGDCFKAAGIEVTVHEAPGHTRGSVFYEMIQEDRHLLFTGDALGVDEDCAGASLGWEGGVDYDRQQFFESIKRFSVMSCDIILPGHFQVCMQQGGQILNDAYRLALESWRAPGIHRE